MVFFVDGSFVDAGAVDVEALVVFLTVPSRKNEISLIFTDKLNRRSCRRQGARSLRAIEDILLMPNAMGVSFRHDTSCLRPPGCSGS